MEAMTNNPDVLFSLLNDAANRKDKRDELKQQSETQGPRTEAFQWVANVFSDQLVNPLPKDGAGVDFSTGVCALGELFTSMPTSDEEIACAIELAKTDKYAYEAAKLLCIISVGQLQPALQKWNEFHYLGLLRPPHKRAGSRRYKFVHRDMLIVGQIKKLLASGLNPTRNEASFGKSSACDLVVDALSISGLAISYSAVEAVWKGRENAPNLKVIADLFVEALLQKT